jgi:hypothetical protein
MRQLTYTGFVLIFFFLITLHANAQKQEGNQDSTASTPPLSEFITQHKGVFNGVSIRILKWTDHT